MLLMKIKKMKATILFKLLSLLVIIGISLSIMVVFFPNYNIFNQTPVVEPIPIQPVISQALQNLINAQSQNNISRNQPTSTIPVLLKIPIMKVDAAVESLGITSNLITAQSQSNVSSEQTNSNLPIRLKIPAIKVDAAVEYLGVTPEGAMDVPKGPDNVGWFDLGSRPGEIGSAVVAGHEGWKNNIPAVFDDLYKLKIGDKIYVIDDLGATTAFVVSKIRIYDQYEDATNVFSSNDGKAHLNLVTCDGVWNATLKGRPSRLVIFTDKE